MSNEKIFTLKQVGFLVFAIVVGIAFIETPAGAVWTWTFWREFLLNIVVYGGASEFIVILFGSFLDKHEEN